MNTTRTQSEVERTFEVFTLPGQTISVQALHCGTARALSTCVASVREAVITANGYDARKPYGVYFTPNPVAPSFAGGQAFPKDPDILSRRWLLIDCDPVRPTSTQCSEPEREAAWSLLDRCLGTLQGAGFRGEVIGDSGNGWHLCYPLDLPNDDRNRELVRQVLNGLQEQCGDSKTAEDRERIKRKEFLLEAKATVGVECYDAKRIWPVYGTWKRKGVELPERPYRQTRLIEGELWDETTARHNNERIPELLVIWQRIRDKRQGRPVGQEGATPQERARLYVEKMPPAVSGDHGHDQTFEVAQVLVRGFSLAPEEAWPILEEYNRRCVPPWSEKELWHKLESARETSRLPPGYLLNAAPSNGHSRSNGQGLVTRPATVEPEPWGTPIPLDAPPAALLFPLEVLPGTLKQYVEECAWATNTPPDFTAIPLLVLAGAAIGNSNWLAIKSSHEQSACLFAACVGVPGTGKSIPLTFLLQPFGRLEQQWHQEWEERFKAWKDAPDPATRGDKPRLQRCFCDDINAEGLVRFLAENPRGGVRVLDELSALVTGLNQYKEAGKGSDRQMYLKIWAGAKIVVDRVKNEGIPLVVHRPFLSIVGGIQPQVMEWIKGEANNGKPPPDDGLVDRFLISYPTIPPAIGEQWRELSQEVRRAWGDAVERLFWLEMPQADDGSRYPNYVRLAADGKATWQQETTRHATEINGLGEDHFLRGPWAKFTGYAGRLALVIHLLRWACREVGETDKNVDGESMCRAWKLVDYFKSHTRKMLSAMGADPRVQEARKVLDWMARNQDKKVFSRRDVYEDLRRSFVRPEDLENPLRLLVEHDYLRPVPAQTRVGAGRPSTPRYEVNPLGTSQNPNNPINDPLSHD